MIAPMTPDEFDEELSSDSEETERERRWSEGVLRDTLRKAVEKGIEAGVGTLRSADSADGSESEERHSTHKQFFHLGSR